jgi:DNA helicase-2/ATP-dependent DNA helicase PcrA
MDEPVPPGAGHGASARESELLAALDPEQRAAVSASARALLIVAGAGSGKTRTLTHRAAWATLAWRLEPDRVLVVSFTNKAVDEMSERLRSLVGHEAAGLMSCLTFHAAAWRLCVRPHRHWLGRPVATIYSHDQSLAAIRRAMKGGEHSVAPGEALARIGWAKAHGLTPGVLAARSRGDREVARLWLRYRDELRAAWAIDFEGLMAAAVWLLEAHADVRRAITRRFDALLVDEYQDASPLQHRWVRLMASGAARVTAAGDDDQALYRFRGGDANGMLEFADAFPGAHRLTLGRNYRSASAIVDAAARLIAHNPRRVPKPLRAMRVGGERGFSRHFDQGEEAVADVFWVEEQLARGRVPEEIAVLARTGRYTRFVERALTARGLPYHVVGRRRLLEHAEVRDAVAFLHFVHNPHNHVALMRAAGRVRGLGPKSIAAVVAGARRAEIAPVDLLAQPERVDGLAPAHRARVAELAGAIADVRAALSDRGVWAACEAAQVASGWHAELAGATEPDERRRAERLAMLGWLAQRFEADGGEGLEEFLAQIALSDGAEGNGEGIAVSTIHAAKGLEWPCVCVVGAAEGELPHHRAIRGGGEQGLWEERRVAYVAFTRAMDTLLVSAAERIEGRKQRAAISRFVGEAGLVGPARRAA